MIVSEIIDLFQRRNIMMSRTRLDVIHALYKQDEPIGAIELWMSIHKTHKISLSAVYSGLNLLWREGIVEKMRQEDFSLYCLK